MIAARDFLFTQRLNMHQHRFTNNLINETSPYLLQHAHNPVHWHAWNDETLQKVKAEGKPVLVSIGYSACHWCHVMERESFEDEATAQVMNENFINIKIDREERPDIDHIYMDAVQAIAGNGGWPLNVFLTPDLKPFYGGTYFPPEPAFNRSSWKEVLLAVAAAYKEKRNEITEQAENLTAHLLSANNFRKGNLGADEWQHATEKIADNLIKASDKEWGGFGQAPKFPQVFSILFLLRHYYFAGSSEALKNAVLSLDKMLAGGIYDHIGGGFCRYSTDKRWQIPHFEKMLYDNALLVSVYAEAYQLTKNETYATVVQQTVEFVERELTDAEGGFYSALDADSEGVEGKYYTWSKAEIDALLKENAAVFSAAFNITEAGNWEHTNIVWQPETLDRIAGKLDLSKTELQNRLEDSRKILFAERNKRIRPGLDNKILLGWNALFITALCKAYAAIQNERYLEMAKKALVFIERNLVSEENGLLHSWNKKPNKQPAFLDDCASLINAYISLHWSTADVNYLLKASQLVDTVIELFSDEDEVLFYFTSNKQTDVILRKTEIYDGATPSGNALMAFNLAILSVYFDKPGWKKRAEAMVDQMANFILNYPTSFSLWALTLQILVKQPPEIAIVGAGYATILKQVLHEYMPGAVLQASEKENPDWPLVRGKYPDLKQTNIYICQNYSCLKPLTGFEAFKECLINIFNKNNCLTK